MADRQADVDALDRFGQTALRRAAVRGDTASVRQLISEGADLNRTAKHGLSALMLAVINRHEEIARILVAAGADASLKGSGAPGFAGKTAADLARSRGDLGLAALIDVPVT